MKKIGIILIDWKDKLKTESAVKLLLDYGKLNKEVILVQVETNKDSHDNLDHPDLVKIFHKDNVGFGVANNLGLERAKELNCDYSLLLNNDASIEEEDILKLVSSMDSNKSAFCVGPILAETLKGKTNRYLGGRDISKYHNTRLQYDAKVKGRIQEVDYVIGAVVLINNTILTDVGLFDKDYFFSGEMADLCYRARKKGYKCLTDTTAHAFHYPENHNMRQYMYQYYSLRNRIVFIRKNKLPKRLMFNWMFFMLKETVYHFITFDMLRFRMFAISLLHSLRSKKGNQNHLFMKLL